MQRGGTVKRASEEDWSGALVMNGKNRITFYGPKGDGTYVVEFIVAGGEALAIAILAVRQR
jgi:hypothetical protein